MILWEKSTGRVIVEENAVFYDALVWFRYRDHVGD